MASEHTPPDQPVGPAVDFSPPPLPAREPLEGRFCRLEPLDPDRHADSLFAANALDVAGRNWTYLAYGPFHSPAPFRAWLEQSCAGIDPLFFAVVDRKTAQATGVASYLRITPSCGSIEIGHLNFSPLLQKTAAATETIFLLMDHAFHLGYRRLEWKCDALNAPSRAAALRFGLSFEGIFRQATVVKGRNRDTAWYAAIDREWPALRNAFRQWLDPGNFDSEGRQKVSLSGLTKQNQS